MFSRECGKLSSKTDMSSSIRLKQYENLRECFQKKLVNPILGKDYYNLAHDVYTSDLFTVEDIHQRFKEVQSDVKQYRGLFYASIILNLGLIYRYFTH